MLCGICDCWNINRNFILYRLRINLDVMHEIVQRRGGDNHPASPRDGPSEEASPWAESQYLINIWPLKRITPTLSLALPLVGLSASSSGCSSFARPFVRISPRIGWRTISTARYSAVSLFTNLHAIASIWRPINMNISNVNSVPEIPR